MASIEQSFIDNSPLTPLFYVRLIDDIFVISTHVGEELEQFATRAKSTHPSMKFSTEISSTSLPFLGVLVVSLKSVLKQRYTENQQIAFPTLCIVVSILIT